MEVLKCAKKTTPACRNFMIIEMVVLVVFLMACAKEDIVSMVKKSTLSIDKTVSIGQAFDKYEFFSEKHWENFIDGKERKIARFCGVFHLTFDSYVNEAVYAAKNATGIQHNLEEVNVLYEYINGAEICRERWEKNKTEASRVLNVESEKKGYRAKIIIDFAQAMNSEEVAVVNKELVFFKEVGGDVVTLNAACNADLAVDSIMVDIYRNKISSDVLKRCLFNYDINQCKLAKKKYY